MQKAKTCISNGLYAIFCIIFCYVSCHIFFHDTIHGTNCFQLLPGLLTGVGLLALTYYLASRWKSTIEQYYRGILITTLLLFFIYIWYTGFQLRFTPAFDMDAIYSGAVQWLTEGSFTNQYEYMGYFPNNLGGMTFLYWIFSIAHWFGCEDYFAVGMTFNCLLITTTILLITLTAKKCSGSVNSIVALVTCLCFFPFYILGAAFYTDSLSMIFPILFYYLYLHWKEASTPKKQWILGCIMVFTITLGMLIKFTVVIALIAVIIDGLLHINWKKIGLFALLCVLFSFIFFKGFDAYMYHNHLDKATSDELRTPYWHWIMMGLQNNGYYNADDYTYTRSYPASERTNACKSVIHQRIKDLGFTGLWQLWLGKATVCFGDGTIAVSDFLDDTPAETIELHSYILYNGEHYPSYYRYATGYLLSIYFLMVFGICITYFKEKNHRKNLAYLAPRLCTLGILAFLLLWETNARYITNYIPMFLLSASFAFIWFENKQIGGNKND